MNKFNVDYNCSQYIPKLNCQNYEFDPCSSNYFSTSGSTSFSNTERLNYDCDYYIKCCCRSSNQVNKLCENYTNLKIAHKQLLEDYQKVNNEKNSYNIYIQQLENELGKNKNNDNHLKVNNPYLNPIKNDPNIRYITMINHTFDNVLKPLSDLCKNPTGKLQGGVEYYYNKPESFDIILHTYKNMLNNPEIQNSFAKNSGNKLFNSGLSTNFNTKGYNNDNLFNPLNKNKSPGLEKESNYFNNQPNSGYPNNKGLLMKNNQNNLLDLNNSQGKFPNEINVLNSGYPNSPYNNQYIPNLSQGLNPNDNNYPNNNSLNPNLFQGKFPNNNNLNSNYSQSQNSPYSSQINSKYPQGQYPNNNKINPNNLSGELIYTNNQLDPNNLNKGLPYNQLITNSLNRNLPYGNNQLDPNYNYQLVPNNTKGISYSDNQLDPNNINNKNLPYGNNQLDPNNINNKNLPYGNNQL